MACGKNINFLKNDEGDRLYTSLVVVLKFWRVHSGACSHSRSHSFFTESITTTVGFQSELCADWSTYQTGACAGNSRALMGDKTPTGKQDTIGYFKTSVDLNPQPATPPIPD
uniref:Uncharacterized protein n=1 Tax=Timema shepardi TaxID=629360 RepID=A0A7R9BBK7_TIMSH|nr:unnamed protein product [Timema shepardi]